MACLALTMFRTLALFGLLAATADRASAESPCTELIASFNRAVDGGREGEAQRIVDTVAVDSACAQVQVPMQRRLAAFRLASAQTLMARGRPAEEYEPLVVAADRPEVLWQAAATLGEIRFGERRFADAAPAFDRALEIINNERLTPTPPSAFEIDNLLARAAQARILAANTPQGGSFVRTAAGKRDGRLGGIFTPRVRGIVPRAVPVPVTFEYRSAVLTPVGEEAARELLRAIREQDPNEIVLVGHTDVRGGEDYNLRLSKARAETVAAFLRENGVSRSIEARGVGASEPMRIGDTSGLSQEDIYALNRRVEWRRQ